MGWLIKLLWENSFLFLNQSINPGNMGIVNPEITKTISEFIDLLLD